MIGNDNDPALLFVHRARAALNNAVCLGNGEEGSEKAPDIEGKAHILDIVTVQLCLIGYLKLVTAVYLRPACKPGLDGICAVFIALGYEVVLVPKRRTRPHDSHVLLQNIEYLRKLIKRGLSQKTPDLCDVFIGVG